MKTLLDFLPLVFFFGTFKYAEGHASSAAQFATEYFGFMVSGGVVGPAEAPVLLATLVVMVATLLQMGALLLWRQKIHLMLWITLVLVLVLGGATIWFHNATFIKWKPSVLYWAMGLAFWVSQTFFHKNLLQATMGEQLQLPPDIWRKLTLAWIAFFGVMGLINLAVAYNFSTSTWASFKVFGATGLMLVFVVGQGIYLSRHLPAQDGTGN